jgi:hypothetical protein
LKIAILLFVISNLFYCLFNTQYDKDRTTLFMNNMCLLLWMVFKLFEFNLGDWIVTQSSSNLLIQGLLKNCTQPGVIFYKITSLSLKAKWANFTIALRERVEKIIRSLVHSGYSFSASCSSSKMQCKGVSIARCSSVKMLSEILYILSE